MGICAGTACAKGGKICHEREQLAGAWEGGGGGGMQRDWKNVGGKGFKESIPVR